MIISSSLRRDFSAHYHPTSRRYKLIIGRRDVFEIKEDIRRINDEQIVGYQRKDIKQGKYLKI